MKRNKKAKQIGWTWNIETAKYWALAVGFFEPMKAEGGLGMGYAVYAGNKYCTLPLPK